MKAAIAFAALSLAIAGSAAASERATDMDYLKANRCKGLAEGIGQVDTAQLDAFLKTESRGRAEYIYQRGHDELARAKRDAGRSGMKESLSAELNGPCMAYIGGGKDVASTR